MSVDDIPIGNATGRSLAKRDVAVLESAAAASFRFEQTRLRLSVALRNGLSHREAMRLKQLGPRPTSAPWWLWSELVATFGTRRGALGALAAAAAVASVWMVDGESARQAAEVNEAPQVQVRAASQPATDRFGSLEDTARSEVAEHGAGAAMTAKDREAKAPEQTSVGAATPTSEALSAQEDSTGALHPQPLPESNAFNSATQMRLRRGWRATAASVAHDGKEKRDGSSAVATQAEAERDTVALSARRNRTAAERAPTVQRDDATPVRNTNHGELTLLSRARRAIAAGDYRVALNWTKTHRQRFRNGELVEEREALHIEALRGLGREREARRASGEFRQRFPRSVLSQQTPASNR